MDRSVPLLFEPLDGVRRPGDGRVQVVHVEVGRTVVKDVLRDPFTRHTVHPRNRQAHSPTNTWFGRDGDDLLG